MLACSRAHAGSTRSRSTRTRRCWIIAIVVSVALYPGRGGALVIVVPSRLAGCDHAAAAAREQALERQRPCRARRRRIEIELDREPGPPLPSVIAHERSDELGERGGRAAVTPAPAATRAPTSSATCREDVTASSLCACRSPTRSGFAETGPGPRGAADARRLSAPRRARTARIRRRGRSGAWWRPSAAAAPPSSTASATTSRSDRRAVSTGRPRRRGSLTAEGARGLAARRGRGAARRRPAAASRARRRLVLRRRCPAVADRSSARRCGVAAAAWPSSTPPGGDRASLERTGRSWQRALELLAVAEPDARGAAAASSFGSADGPTARVARARGRHLPESSSHS